MRIECPMLEVLFKTVGIRKVMGQSYYQLPFEVIGFTLKF